MNGVEQGENEIFSGRKIVHNRLAAPRRTGEGLHPEGSATRIRAEGPRRALALSSGATRLSGLETRHIGAVNAQCNADTTSVTVFHVTLTSNEPGFRHVMKF